MPFMYKIPHSHDPTSPLPNSKPPPPPLPIHRHDLRRHHLLHNQSPTMFSPPHRLMLATSTWLRTRRSRCVVLLLFSPILLPFVCATLPLLCAAELCIRLCRRGRRKKDEDGGDRLRRCEEGFCDCEEEEGTEVGLLHRYLEDQLRLVGSVYECGDEFDDDDDGQDGQNHHHDYNLNTPLLG